MRTKTSIGICFILSLTVILLWVQPTMAQNLSYAPGLYPTALHTQKLHWRINNVTNAAVEYGFGSGTFWQAEADQTISFEIQEIVNDELRGLFTIGNLTIPANDSRIAAEIVFSIWPWFPGLVSHLDWSSVDQSATEVAASFYMNGSLEIETTSTTKTYEYHQGPWGNQNTTLTYDLGTGILLSAYTEFFFLNDYHLGIDFLLITQNPTNLATLLFVAILVVVLIIVIASLAITGVRTRKE